MTKAALFISPLIFAFGALNFFNAWFAHQHHSAFVSYLVNSAQAQSLDQGDSSDSSNNSDANASSDDQGAPASDQTDQTTETSASNASNTVNTSATDTPPSNTSTEPAANSTTAIDATTSSSAPSSASGNQTNPPSNPPPISILPQLPLIPEIPNAGPVIPPASSISNLPPASGTNTASDTATTQNPESTSTTSNTPSPTQDSSSTSATTSSTSNSDTTSSTTTTTPATDASSSAASERTETSTTPANPPAGNIFETGAVTFRFDDGWSSQLDAVPVLDAAGIKGTFYIVTHQLSDDGFTGFISSAQVQQIASDGHEIGAHTRTHAHLPTLSSSQQQNEIEGSKADLQSMGLTAQTFSYPYGEYTSDTTQIVKGAGFASAASTIETAVAASSDRYQLPSPSITLSQSPAEIESMIDNAITSHQWLIMTFHRIDSSGDQYSITPSNFQEVVDYVKSHSIPTVTVSQGVSQLQ